MKISKIKLRAIYCFLALLVAAPYPAVFFVGKTTPVWWWILATASVLALFLLTITELRYKKLFGI